MKPNFCGPDFTVGIEEELMILDAGSLSLVNGIEDLLDAAPEGEVHPELMESVLEIATRPCSDTREAGRELRGLRRRVIEAASTRDLTIGAAGTHPTALWEDQRISARPRYRELVAALRSVARREIIFGLHVHVGIDDADKAIHVANGMREHLPILLALSANSPFWRGEPTGLASARMPIFRAVPRVGVPPVYRDWADYQERIAFMQRSGVLENYTFLWYDVRPHPNLGTVEIRAMDAQTRIEHTLGLAALVQAMVRELAIRFEEGKPHTPHPREMIDENRWLAARHGLEGELVDLPDASRVPAKELAARLLERLRDHAEDLGSAGDLEGIADILERGTGAARQVVVYEANRDFHELMREIVQATAA